MNPAATIKSGASSAFTTAQSAVYQFEEVNTNFDNTCNDMLHHVYSVSKEANESYTFKEMLQQEDKHEFMRAMLKDIRIMKLGNIGIHLCTIRDLKGITLF